MARPWRGRLSARSPQRRAPGGGTVRPRSRRAVSAAEDRLRSGVRPLLARPAAVVGDGAVRRAAGVAHVRVPWRSGAVDPRVDRTDPAVCRGARVSGATAGHGRPGHRRREIGVGARAALRRAVTVIARLRRLVWVSWRPIAERAARAYVAGPALSDALRV